MTTRHVVIIGSGPAGLTAALYAARGNLQPLVVEGLEAGGQLMLTTLVENWPGIATASWVPISWPRCARRPSASAPRFVQGHVASVDLRKAPFRIKTAEAEYEARALIIATGASARMLGMPGERGLVGHGVSTCATCDGYFFRGHEIAVVGGGDSAMEEAVFLTKFASKVTVVHRRSTLRASKIMQDKASANPKIAWAWNSEVEAIRDVEKGEVTGLVLKDNVNGDVRELPVTGVFVAIGHTPNTKLFRGQIDMDAAGYIVTHDGAKTNVPGVFACGDVQDHVYRQAVTAAGSGCMAAIDAEHYLEGVPDQSIHPPPTTTFSS